VPPTVLTSRTLRRRRQAAGLAIVEMLIAMGILAFVLLSSITGLLNANRQAAAYRAMTAARVVVERNIETALATTWNSTSTPAILATTSSSGIVYDDDGGNDSQVNLMVQNSTGSNVLLKGTLLRIVVDEPNPRNAPLKRVTFRLNYTFRGRAYSTEMTTLRATDDF
jgi:hypothetical protein